MWSIQSFSELSTKELYDILKLRVDVFVVEQNCAYPEIDGYDEKCHHVTYINDGQLAAYARIVPAGTKYDLISIGRVIVHPSERGKKRGNELMEQCLAFIESKWPNESIQLQAQAHLQKFYGAFGFETISDPYIEDAIPHVDMVYKK